MLYLPNDALDLIKSFSIYLFIFIFLVKTFNSSQFEDYGFGIMQYNTHTTKKKKKPIGKMNIQPMHGIVLSIVEVDLSMVKADLCRW